MLPEPIVSMLRDIGLEMDCDTHVCEHNVEAITRYKYRCKICLKVVDLHIAASVCCSEVMIQDNSGYCTCHVCGNSVYDPELQYHKPFVKEGAPFQSDGMQWKKKRYYNKNIHFKTQLNRYLGVTDLEDTEKLMWFSDLQKVVDVSDRSCYKIVREFLRIHKLTKYYPHIFTLIYRLGGTQPLLTQVQHQRCLTEFDALRHYFCDMHLLLNTEKLKRTSMLSVPMILQMILRQVGHIPYYDLHELKDPVLYEKVIVFYNKYLENVVYNRQDR